MKFKDVENIVGKVPYINKSNADFIYNFIIENKIQNILELGIAHGTATCYMAAALNEIGKGRITAVDLQSVAEHFKPSCEEQLKKCNLEKYVEIHRMKTGYNWFLHNEIKESTTDNKCQEKYDLCIIDGPKNWIIDSSAFFLVDKLLKKGGYIIFDDYSWTYEDANNRRESTDGIQHDSLSNEELKIPHIKEIFDLLLKQHPNYSNFKVFNDKE
ncbi:MAG: class I SAM-dependent methyltransferase, partial [Sulfurospirillum sp.]|nr:class I SAM-dependent methyltransferase [Sulfurospirillum sp.]